VSVSAVAAIKAAPALPVAIDETVCGKTTEQTLDFNPLGNSGWTSYSLGANAPTIRDLFDGLPSCKGSPAVDKGFCTNLINGTIANLFSKDIPDLFKRNPGGCYLLPVVGPLAIFNFNGCSEIKDWAEFCPNPDVNVAVGHHELKGTVTCGKSIYTSRASKCYYPFLVRDPNSGM
jgi:hypothetical protein